jgi:hypothetical protein
MTPRWFVYCNFDWVESTIWKHPPCVTGTIHGMLFRHDQEQEARDWCAFVKGVMILVEVDEDIGQ